MRLVDLTLSSDDDEPQSKRRRTEAPPRPRARPSARAAAPEEDSDVVVIDSASNNDIEVLGPSNRGVAAAAGIPDLGDDEEVAITGHTGTVATRDLPHPRPDCADHRFNAGAVESNAQYCPQCFCYVCDVKASECRFWGTGARERDHANARHLGYWRRLRGAARAGNHSFVASEYQNTGPLGTGVPASAGPQQTRLNFQPAPRTAPTGVIERRPLTTAAAGAAMASAGAAAAGAAAAGPSAGHTGGRAAAVAPSGAVDGELRTPGQPSGAGPQAAAEPSSRQGPTTAALESAAHARAPSTAGEAQAAAEAVPRPSGNATGGPAVKKQPSEVELPSGKCTAMPLPDPADDRQAFELGVLRLGVKASNGLRIADIAERVPRFGFYYSTGRFLQDYGDQMPLDRIIEVRYGTYNGKYKQKAVYLKLKPLPPPPEEAVPVPTERVRKVLVVDCLGRSPATYVGVRLDSRAKRADLLAALVPSLRPAFSPAGETLHLINTTTMDNAAGFHTVDPNRSLDDAFFSSYACSSAESSHVIVFRTAQHPSPEVGAGPSGSGTDGTQMPVYTYSATHSAPPAWVLLMPKLLKAQPGPDAAAADRWAGNLSRFAVPLLVPLRKEHIRGGKDAAKELNAAVVRALQPYRTTAPLSASAAAPAVVLRGGYYGAVPSDPSRVPSRDRWGIAGEALSTIAGSLCYLTPVWPQDSLAAAYRLEGMLTPTVDASALPEALKQSEANIAEQRRRLEGLARRKALPRECIAELIHAAERPHPEDNATTTTFNGSGQECLVALDVELKPLRGPGASAREGELVIKVYAWTSRQPLRGSIFQPWDEWSSLGKKDSSRCPLSATMELLATGAADPTEQQPREGAGASTSAASGRAPLAALHALRRRIHAERQRAREMMSRVRALRNSSAADCRSINGLLEFMQSGERPSVRQPDGLTVSMRPYQLQSLAFMLEMEGLVEPRGGAGAGAGPSTSAASGVDPADPDAPDSGNPGGYRQLFWLPITNPSTGQRYWYSPVLQRVSREVPPQPTGGFLAEEMGLGKTVEVMALTLANPPPPSVVAGSVSPCGRIVSRATLVVCAVSLVGQWQAEAQSKTTEACRIHPYHGQSRIRDPKRLATDFDVVVTTYQTLQSDHASGKHPCQSILWHRIVFDEGHTLRNASAKLYKMAVELASQRRWLCTGTPINNAIDDLLGQFGALHMMPLGKKTYFDSYIKGPFNGGARFYNVSPLPLLYTLRHALIRHTKAQNLGGEGVLQLPPKTETDVPVLLSEAEQAVYRRVHKEAAWGWQKLRAMGTSYVNSHLFTATSMLMPMRRICSGGMLQPRDLTVPDPERLAAVAAGAGGSGGSAAPGGGAEVPVPADVTECPICVDGMEVPVVTPCNHWFCRECISGWINSSAHHNCPACRQPVAISTLRRGVSAALPAAAAADGDGAPSDGSVACESKLRALLAELRAMREADPEAKALVFTQFGQTLEWLKPRLQEEGFGHRSITGDMTQKRRTEAIASFQRDPATSVFLLSVRSGAVGINLTAANHVFLLEPCMNPAMEEQAIGRAWRMGQQRPVVVKRLYVKGSVEERIMEVVKERRAAGGGGSGSGSAAGSSTGGAGPSGSTGPAGSLRQDKTDLRITELEALFGEPQFPAATA